MMLYDRYDNPLSTSSTAARDAYITGLDLFLAADAGADQAFETALEADRQFALAYVGLARNQHVLSKGKQARANLAQAQALSDQVTPQEQSHIAALDALIEGQSSLAYQQVRAHLLDYPRDALVAQSCLGVFSLIGFSGLSGREAAALALAEQLAPHYGEDWWFLSALSFSQSEVGQNQAAASNIERALALNPRNANGAHHRAHLYYEMGETDAGYNYLTAWHQNYDQAGLLHCHLAWHIALWALARGDVATMWHRLETDLNPNTSPSPPINILTDTAALLYRAEMAGVVVPQDHWQRISAYASEKFPKPRIAFADAHAALAHAMAGNASALETITQYDQGPAADLVVGLAHAFQAIAAHDWPHAATALTGVMADHERLGGSRAQRDLIDYAMAGVLLKLGQREEAQRLLKIRRPIAQNAQMVAGL